MKIALIRREYITHLDGVNKFIALLAEAFVRLGHSPFIVSWCYRDVKNDRLEEWFRMAHGLDNIIPICTLKLKSCEGDPWLRIAWDWWINGSRLLHLKGTDVAIINGVVPLQFKPKIAVNHGITLKSNKLYLYAIKSLYKRYDRVVCVSCKSKNEIRDFANCDVIPLPIKLELFRHMKKLDERENTVVHIGTRPVKNPHISLEAVRILRKRGYNIRLAIVGSPITYIKDEEGVEWKYTISEKEKIELLCRAKILILPSNYESFPYASLEAMASGTPTVVSIATSEETVINGFNGIRVNSYNPEDYANALEQLLRNEELWLKLSKNSLEFVKKFDYVEVAKAYEDLFRRL